MNSIRLILIGVVLLFFPICLLGQQITDQAWQTEEDFRAVEPIVLENIEWLENHPLATPSNDTKALTEYVLNWLSGTPYIAVKYDEIFLDRLANSKKYKFGEKFRITYLFGKSYYMINNQSEASEISACSRGIEGMVAVYAELKKVDSSVHHGMLEKYSRLLKTGKLESYVKTTLEKEKNDTL